MSLINEALRKARQEAAERAAEERGVAYRPPRAHLPPERRGGLMLGLGIGVVLALVTALVLWFLLRPGAPTTPPGTGTAGTEVAAVAPAATTPTPGAPTPTGAPSTDPAPPDAGSADVAEATDVVEATDMAEAPPAPAPVAEAPAPPPAEAPAPTPPPAEARVPSERTAEAPAPAPAPRTPPPRADVPPEGGAPGGAQAPTAGLAPAPPPLIEPPETVGRVDDGVFVLEGEVDGVRLTLDFIVWSPEEPYAQINGKLLGIGQMIEGWQVAVIDREQVTLRQRDGRVTLRVR